VYVKHGGTLGGFRERFFFREKKEIKGYTKQILIGSPD